MDTQKMVENLIVAGIKKSMSDDGLSFKKIGSKITEVWEEKLNSPEFLNEQKKTMLEQIKESGIGVKVLEMKKADGAKKELGVVHYKLERLINVVNNKMPVLLVGLPGVGKTFSAEKVAEALNIPFHAISVGQQTTKSDILGFMSATGTYVGTPFRKAFENGGVFLMDEIDAGNPNVLVQMNSAISNGFVEFPDKMVRVHKNFRFIGTANTYGGGINSMFVGRNQLDAATLDRFVVIDWAVDENLELVLVQDAGLCSVGKQMRKIIKQNEIEMIVSTRALLFIRKLLNLGFSKTDAFESGLFRGVGKDMKRFFTDVISGYKPETTPELLAGATETKKPNRRAIGGKKSALTKAVAEVDKMKELIMTSGKGTAKQMGMYDSLERSETAVKTLKEEIKKMEADLTN